MAAGPSSNLESVLWDIANVACDRATGNAGGLFRTFRGGRACFFPKVDVNGRRVGIGLNPTYHYLIYQENGFQAFTMRWALGRTIRMVLPGGAVIFRKCVALNRFRSGRRTYWYRDENGELVGRDQQRRSWVHPGVPPSDFMRRSVSEAVVQGQHDIDGAIMADRYEELERRLDWSDRWQAR